MASKSLRINIILRSVFICLNIYVFFFLLFQTRYIFAIILAGALSLLQCVLLIVRIDKTNRIWVHLLEAVKHADFTRQYSLPADRTFRKLRSEYAEVMGTLRQYSLEKEKQSHYLQTVTRSIDVGVAVYTQRGDVDFCNEAFKRLLSGDAPPDAAPSGQTAGAVYQSVQAMKNGENKLIRIGSGGDRLQLIAAVKDFILLRDKYRLVSVQNIRRELEENEMDAWQKMARVLTHEIMNSITPIASLASTANHIVAKLLAEKNPDGKKAAAGRRDAAAALRSIEKRSRGLLHFVENYRKFLGVPQPVLRMVSCREALVRVKTLMQGVLEDNHIGFRISVRPRHLEVSADNELLDQALLNLAFNSVEALGGVKKPLIAISAYENDRGRTVIDIADNGRGIAPENIEKAFIPFFTTKREGSGIGLSLCRQIMRLHNGTISVNSVPGEKTVFTLSF